MALELFRMAILMAGTSLVPQSPTVCDKVDEIELNHVYDGDGTLVFSQLIFWDWHHNAACYQVVAWRLWKPKRPLPLRNWRQGSYCLLLQDGTVLRSIQAKRYHESWTQFDPEIADRGWLSQDQRRQLHSVGPPSISRTARPFRR